MRSNPCHPVIPTNPATITPEGASTFEQVVRRLGLSLYEYASSAELKAWVRKDKDEKYVLLQLLSTTVL